MELLKLYKEENRDILYSMSWLNKNSIFDKSIGSFEEIDLFTFLENVNQFDYTKDTFYDDVYYILEYTKDSIVHLINNINKEIKREHKILPISQAKEFDHKTILWLSRQDGRTIKEKLKKNKIKTVKRYKNVDTYENRIFKKFLKILVLIYEEREDLQNSDITHLFIKIRQWLRSDDAKSIDEHRNIVYNNILLHHSHYSKIFKSYKWLNRLDEKITKYKNLYPRQIIDILTFSTLAKLQFKTDKLVLSDILNIDYSDFNIEFNEKCLPEKINLIHNISNLEVETIGDINFNNIINLEKNLIENQINLELNQDRTFIIDSGGINKIFIDLFRLFPIASIEKKIINFPILLKQKIKNNTVNTNNTKVIDLNNEIYTLPEILKTYDTGILKYFLEDFKKYFKDQQLNYIIPDYVNIFEFSQVKKSINSYFPNNRNIPKSILAGLQYLFKNDCNEEDTLIYIQKDHNNTIFITPLLIRYDENLASITNGLYIEKHPTKKLIESTDILDAISKIFPIEISQKLLNKFLQNGIKKIKEENVVFQNNDDIVTLENLEMPNAKFDETSLDKIKEIYTNNKLFKEVITYLDDDNIENLNNYEQLLEYEKNGFILWREHLPKLSMQIVNNGYFDEFVLVNDESEVTNGNITISNHFVIPANTNKLSFPLVFDEENINFEAYITSNDLPLTYDLICELHLTYNYEHETPYELTFISTDNLIKPLKVNWREIQYIECKDLPIPIYPARKKWRDFEHFINNRNETIDLLEWMAQNFNDIIKISNYLQDTSRENSILDKNWEKDINNKEFQDITTSLGNIRIYKNKFLNGGEKISFNLVQKGRYYRAVDILSDKDYSRIRKSIRFPLFTIWNNGNSLSDIEVPDDFRCLATDAISASINILKMSNDINLKKEIFLFLCSLHKDSPNSISNTLVGFFHDKKNIKNYREHISYSVGCLETPIQKKLFEAIINLLNSKEEKDYSNALKMLGIILWRCENIIFEISENNFNLIIDKLINSLMLKLKASELFRNNNIKMSVVIRLELLFSLLRYRKKSPTVLSLKELPTKTFVKIIDNITKTTIKNKLQLNSRIQLDVTKSKEFDDTPNLLYTLRVYLTGDNYLENSIKILGISDD